MKRSNDLTSAKRPFKAVLPGTLVVGGLLAAATFAVATPAATAQEMGIASYTEEQIARGEDAYVDECGICHGRGLGGDGESPGLIGNFFSNNWFGENPASKFFSFISNAMPQQAPGSLEPQMYADIMAYIVSRNGYPGGDAELPSDVEVLDTLTFPERVE